MYTHVCVQAYSYSQREKWKCQVPKKATTEYKGGERR